MTLDIQFQADGGFWTVCHTDKANDNGGETTAEETTAEGQRRRSDLLHWKDLGALLLKQVLLGVGPSSRRHLLVVTVKQM